MPTKQFTQLQQGKSEKKKRPHGCGGSSDCTDMCVCVRACACLYYIDVNMHIDFL